MESKSTEPSIVDLLRDSPHLPKAPLPLTGPKDDPSYMELVKIGLENLETDLYNIKEFK